MPIAARDRKHTSIWIKLLIALVLLFVVAFFAIGWYASGKLVAVNPQKVEYDQTIMAVSGDSYTISGSAYNVRGIMGGIRTNGSMIGIFSTPTDTNAKTSTATRTITDISGQKPVVGEKISLQGNIWTTDPKTALGLDYQNVTYPSSLGAMNAWVVPGTSNSTWTIGVHGVGADKTEMLRFIPAVHAAGNTMMVINYRNDPGNPQSPDGHSHLGDTEWQDVQSAVAYARAHGATNIRLYGDSLGGALVENYLARSSGVTSANIMHVVLDSPALDWHEVLHAQVRRGGYPAFFYYPTVAMLQLRYGINLNDLSTKPEQVTQKTLIIHNKDDLTVPQEASKKLAAAKPDLITLVDFGAGGHLRAWNHDSAKYEQLVTNFLSN